MSRRFGKVTGTLWASDKFRSLPDDFTRLAYVYLHTNPHGNCIGAYRLPVAYLATDLQSTEVAAGAAVGAMVGAGLIAFDEGESVIRIGDWWPYNPLTNRKHLQAAITAITDMPRRCIFRPLVAFEIAENTLSLARGWATDQKGAAAAADALTMCSKMARKIVDEATEASINHAEKSLPIELLIELSTQLSIGQERFSFPDRDRDKRQETQTIDADKRQETDPEASETTAEIIEGMKRRATGQRA